MIPKSFCTKILKSGSFDSFSTWTWDALLVGSAVGASGVVMWVGRNEIPDE